MRLNKSFLRFFSTLPVAPPVPPVAPGPPPAAASTTASAPPPPPPPPGPRAIVRTSHGMVLDTTTLVRNLEAAGLTRNQSEGITFVLRDMFAEMADAKQAATKKDLDEMKFTNKLEIATLKSEMTILEKSDISNLKSEMQALNSKIQTESAGLYTAIERQKNDMIRWLVGSAVSGLAILATILRLVSDKPGHSSSSEERYEGKN
jgi:hypothetical protein